jgi:hypothetical protein
MKRNITIVGITGLLVAALATGGLTYAAYNENIADPYGEFGIAVSPAQIDMQFVPGQTVTETFRIRNLGSATGAIKIGVSPLSYGGLDYSEESVAEAPRTEITRWTNLSFQPGCEAYQVDPDGTLYVDFGYKEECFVDIAVSAPANAPSGSQHMQVYFQEHKELTDSGMQNIRSIGGNVYSSNANNSLDGEGCVTIKQQLVPFWVFEGPLETSAVVENCGELDFYSTIDMEVKNLLGNTVYRDSQVEAKGGKEVRTYKHLDTQRRIVLAETEREVTDAWQEAGIGIYQTTQTVRALGQEFSVTKWSFLIPLWLLLLIIVVILSLIAYIVHKVKKHQRGRKKH